MVVKFNLYSTFMHAKCPGIHGKWRIRGRRGWGRPHPRLVNLNMFASFSHARVRKKIAKPRILAVIIIIIIIIIIITIIISATVGGGFAFILFVCLSVRRITQKVVDEVFGDILEL